MSDELPVIIKRVKKRGHGGHHGGAWKVAYADFVTAMMAFFLVLWLVSQGPDTTMAVAGYFRDPGVFEHGRGASGVGTGADGGPGVQPVPIAGRGSSQEEQRAWASLEQAAERIDMTLRQVPEFRKLREQIEVRLEEDGLRIELIESSETGFFDSGSATLHPTAVAILGAISAELASLNDRILFEGHTDSRPYVDGTTYGNWELSTDRANAARRVMQRAGLPADRVTGVRGYADTQPRITADASDPRNRRVSIVVRPLMAAGGLLLDGTASILIPGGQDAPVSTSD
jgi:chemotaxis protein MotB